MKYVFFGTPSFSARVLEKLLEDGMIPAAVVCNPDRPTGRKKIITAPPVKLATEAWTARTGQAIEIFQPEKLDDEAIAKLRSFGADVFLVFAYHKIFRRNVLDIPRHGIVGIHPSFLPAYRGPSPFQTAILDGAQETGVTLYLLDEGIDSGSILAASNPVAITDQDTFVTLAAKLADTGADLVIKKLPEILAGNIAPVAQDESRATYTKKFIAQDGFISEDDLAEAEEAGNPEKAKEILRKIHALNPEPGTWILRDGKRIKLLEAEIQNSSLKLTLFQKEGEKPKATESGSITRSL